MALYAGAGEVIVLDVDETRLALARKLGAAHIIRTDAEDTGAAIGQITQGRGADLALECVGTAATVGLAIDNVRKGGTVTLVGNVAPRVEIGLQTVVTRQIRLQGSCASSGEYPQSMALMSSGRINVDVLLSAVAPLEDGASWFERLYRREPGLMKVVLQPGTVA
jgi:L-iditol 2-dehydrogenase